MNAILRIAVVIALAGAHLGSPAPARAADDSAYSPFVGRSHPERVLFGDTHLHTSRSPDAYLFGARLGPDEAYRLARGETVVATRGVRVKLVRPLDFLVVADHAEYLGLMPRLFDGDPLMLATAYGRELYDLAHSKERGFFEAAMRLIADLSQNLEKMEVPSLEKAIWEDVARDADRYDQPGKFTALIGYEWTSLLSGNNLHRVVIYRDGAERASARLPFSSFDSPDPEALWAALADYEASTGGKVLAIPHNGNLSNGMMFQTTRIDGRPFDRAYAEMRRRWEPLYEVTQIKGDAETHPLLSPNDEFADYETWDRANLGGTEPKTPAMLPFEYARSALGIGLSLGVELGENPFAFGMIGSTDSHTGLATAREDNFFGKHSGMEPDAERMSRPLAKIGDVVVPGWQMVASGLAAVWARENTREEIFDAMRRRETYATTGPRMQLRVFAGFTFEAADLAAPDFAAIGYAKGVPMGGELRSAPDGASPRFLVRGLRDPDGANLDRIQIVKGWLDSNGEPQEIVHDIALSDGRRPAMKGRAAPVGSTVDLARASYANTIGAASLEAWWRDTDFDPERPAFYYVRALEIPTPRWTAYDAARFGSPIPADAPRVTQERAYTSPIWYTP